MPKLKLTQFEIEKIRLPKTGQVFFWDTKTPGFGIKATVRGLSYVVQRRVKGSGRTCRITLGRHPEVKLEGARIEALHHLADLGAGADPQLERRREVAAQVTLGEIFERYKGCKQLSPATLKIYGYSMNLCLGDWQTTPINQLTKTMIAERHKAISNGFRLTPKKLRRGNGEALANQAMRLLRALLRWAEDTEDEHTGEPYLSIKNPIRRGSLDWNKVQHRTSRIPDEQLAAWRNAVANLRSTTIQDYLLLCLQTGLRRTEAASLTWMDVDLVLKQLRIPKEISKNGYEHRLPISGPVLELLKRRKEAANKVRSIDGSEPSPFVFPGDGDTGRLVESQSSVVKITEESGVRFMIHDLRRTFASTAARLNISKVMIARLLNHRSASVTDDYIQIGLDDMREPMERIACHLQACMNKRPADDESSESSA